MAGIAYMKNGNAASTKKKNKNVLIFLVFFLALLFVISFPFALDFLYGRGWLREPFHNSFSADTWFSFIGSYFPSAIIGVLTIYQAYIIQYKDRQYHKLLVRSQFVSTTHAQVFRYDKNSDKIGDWTFWQVKQMLVQCGKNDLLIGWKKGYIMQCNICVLQGMDIELSELKEIEWKINNKSYYQRDDTAMFCIMERTASNEYRAIMFWKFQDSDEAEEEIIRHMVCGIRDEQEYELSQITLLLLIRDDIDEEYHIKMQFTLQPLQPLQFQQEGFCKVCSVREKYYVM